MYNKQHAASMTPGFFQRLTSFTRDPVPGVVPFTRRSRSLGAAAHAALGEAGGGDPKP